MKKHYDLLFFATEDDIRSVLSELERTISVSYTECEYYPTRVAKTFSSQADIPWLGMASEANASSCKALLIQDRQYSVALQPIKFGDKDVYDVNQILNPKSIIMRGGGKFGSDFIISGQFGTIYRNEESLSLFRLLVKIIESRFRKYGVYHLGPEAVTLLQSGWCLTASANISRSYCLPVLLDL